MTKPLFSLLFYLLTLCLVANGQPDFVKTKLDNFINQGLKQWKVPGLALVIVKDGQVVKMKGYGVKDLTTQQPVDPHTHFFIASNTKLFTGIALANLHHQGLLNLDVPIQTYLPNFRLFDSTVSQLVTIRDLLSHRIGTTTFQGDFTFWNTNLSSEEVLGRMRFLKPSGIFRQDYGYCNSCFLAAAQPLQKLTSLTWDQYVQDSIVGAIGMLETKVKSNNIQHQSTNIATPYTNSYSETLMQVPFDTWDNLGPAASIVSNVHDLAKWLQFQLDSGRVGKKQILPWAVLQQTRQGNLLLRSSRSANYPMLFGAYGLGVFISDYNGKMVYSHGGGAAGMVSTVVFVPEENLGFAVLTNNDNQDFFNVLKYQILDAYLKVPFKDRNTISFKAYSIERASQLNEINAWRNQAANFRAAIDLKPFTGSYQNPLYGQITIAESAQQLQIHFEHHPGLVATLKPLPNDKWLMEYNNILYGIFSTQFALQAGNVVGITIPANPFVETEPYYFTRK